MKFLWRMGCGRSKLERTDSVNSYGAVQNQSEKEQGNGEQLYDSAASIERFHADHSKPDSNNTSSYNHGILSSQPVGSKGETSSPEKGSKLTFEPKTSKSTDASSNVLHPTMKSTGSQLEFFRMLDEKISEGRDYDPKIDV